MNAESSAKLNLMLLNRKLIAEHSAWLKAYRRNIPVAALDPTPDCVLRNLYVWSASRLFY